MQQLPPGLYERVRTPYRWMRRQWRSAKRALPGGWLLFGTTLRRRDPIRPQFGWGSGQCIDRYYIEEFLEQHAKHIRGRVLEVGDDSYTRRFGGDRVTQADVLHALPGNPAATIVADLASAPQLSAASYDCILLTQTLQFIYDVPAALATVARILKPGGTLLVTAHGISQIARHDMNRWGEYWRFTSLSLRKLLQEAFPHGQVQVGARGNVLTATAQLHGILTEELKPQELAYHHPDYEHVLVARVMKRPAG